MARYTQAEKDAISDIFLDLKTDGKYDITSDRNPMYNCIAFAMGFNDIWVSTGRNVPWYWWPPTVPLEQTEDALVKAFEYFGFEVCDNDSIDPGWDKVALYSDGSRWLHAAKIISTDEYHSKLGEEYDIHHGSANNLLENTKNPKDSYGKVYKYMRRKKSNAYISSAKKPIPGKITYGGKQYVYMVPPHITFVP